MKMKDILKRIYHNIIRAKRFIACRARKISANYYLWRHNEFSVVSCKDNVGFKLHDYNKYYEIKCDDVVIDAGAHIGLYSLEASRRAIYGKVIAVEPSPINYALLKINIKINNCRNIIPVNIALGDTTGNVILMLTKSTIGDFVKSSDYLSQLHRLKDVIGIANVKIDTIDNLIRELKLERVDFIKIDVEGFELKVLKGATFTLKEMKPRLAVCCEHFYNEPYIVAKFLRKLKYNIKIEGHMVYASP